MKKKFFILKKGIIIEFKNMNISNFQKSSLIMPIILQFREDFFTTEDWCIWVCILVMSFSSCVNLVNLFNFPEPVYLTVKKKNCLLYPQHKVIGNIKRANACE